MGIETALAVAAIGTSIGGGIMANSAANRQAKNIRIEAQNQAAADKIQSEIAARAETRENMKLLKRQKLAFIKSGVDLEGSPLLQLAYTEEQGVNNVGNMIWTGDTRRQAMIRQASMQASSVRASGRQALLGSISQALSTGASMAARAGAANGPKPPSQEG